MIQLTQAAVREIKRMQASRGQSDSYFCLGVKAGGCSGLYYTLELYQTKQDSNRLYEIDGIPLLIEQHNLPYLKNLRLDYAEDLMGGGFRFHNPQAEANCSCGLSFTLCP